MSLYQHYCNQISSLDSVASSSYLYIISEHIQNIEKLAQTNMKLNDYCDDMLKILSDQYALLKGDKINDFLQKFGEAHFLYQCLEKKIDIERVPETKIKTPDFKYIINEKTVAHFEIKTLSVVDGKDSLNKDISNSMDTKISTLDQLKEGKKIAFGETEVAPYGVYKENGKVVHDKPITQVIKTLLNKSKNNIKAEQYSGKDTFLVLNLILLGTFSNSKKGLCSSYVDDYLFQKPISGDLWMLAFGTPEMLIHGQPQFEGKPCIEGTLNDYGILVDSNYDNIAGIIVMVYQSDSITQNYALLKNSKYENWSSHEFDLLENILNLVDSNWNDEIDSNSWKLLSD